MKALIPSQLAGRIARNRFLGRIFSSLLPDFGELKITSTLSVSFLLKDQTGPSFYLNHGGPAAFYHYEEKEKSEILRALPEKGIFLDLGANIGLFTFFIARHFPQAIVYGFEPHPMLQECLKKTQARNGFKNVLLEKTAVGSNLGNLPFYLHSKNSGGHSLDPSMLGPQDLNLKPDLNVEVTTLDHFADERRLTKIDVIKIDVQGLEWAVLKGGINCIKRDRPFILVEVENKSWTQMSSDTSLVLTQLSQLGYSVRKVGNLDVDYPILTASGLARDELDSGHLQTNYVLTSNRS